MDEFNQRNQIEQSQPALKDYSKLDKITSTECRKDFDHEFMDTSNSSVKFEQSRAETNWIHEDGRVENDDNKNQPRPNSHASTITTKSIQDDLSNAKNQPKTTVSTGASTLIEEILTGKSNAISAENIDNLSSTVESEVIDTSLEHIQNESNEKLIAADSNDGDAGRPTEMKVEDSVEDQADEKTNEIIIESNLTEQSLDAAFITAEKPDSMYDNESRSESDSRSLTSTESSEYPAMHKSTAKTLMIPIGKQKVINKPIAKLRPAIITRRNKVMPIKSYPSSATIHAITAPKMKSTEIFTNHLRNFDKPRDASNNCLHQLENQNWEITMKGLQNFVRLIRHHPEVVESNIHAYCVTLSKHVKNLRSQVSRSACQASAEFFQTHAKHLETECEDLATQLFNRTADTNKFLRADAFRALASMCDNLPPQKVIQTILSRGATHPNAIVRTVAANLCSRIVGRLGCDKIFAMNREHRDKLILAGANFLMEGSLDTRNNAKAFFKQISIHPHYNRVLQNVIPSRIYRNIEKALRSIK